MTVPSILEDLCLMPDEEALHVLASLDFVAVGGGPIKISVGERLVAMGVRLLNHYGATEIGAIAPIFCPQSDYDWHYLRLRKDMGLELAPISGEDSQKGLYKLVGRPFGWDSTFEIADRLVLHPDRPESDFRVQGRTDDLIVLATGEKVMPQNLESALDRSPIVKAALVFGEGQFELGVIVQPAAPVRDGEVEQFVTQLWPEILEANTFMDSHAQILFPEAIIVARDGQHLPRSDKGSLMRKEAYQSFKKEIEEAYRRVEHGDMTQTRSSRAHLDLKNLHSSLQRLVQQCLGNAATDSEADCGYDDDVFELGYDSLRALRLRRLIRVELNIEVEADFVYRNPTINAIAEAVRERMQADGESEGDSTSSPRKLARTKGRAERMWGWVEQYSSIQTTTISQYHQYASDDSSAPEQGAVIVLTGSTGSIGCHLLAYLSHHPKVHQIICLDRPHNPQQPHNRDTLKDNHASLRQKLAVHKHGIELTSHAWSKVTAIATDTSRRHLGIHVHAYKSICSKVTHVIHNAWPMDFKRPLESFKTQFQAVQNLLQLASDASLASSMATRFVFNSSIAAVARLPTITGNSGPIHERYMDDAEATSTIGYAEAKLVCEKIMQRVVVAHPGVLDASIIRIGQICGSEQSGVWNHNEHFPALLKSAQSLRRLPRIEGVSKISLLLSALRSHTDSDFCRRVSPGYP
jgi:nucleoside-diphosphate-sugar epimerase/aryl carrier-like protein